jgi:quercetin dioxygenase-like cupin family protein
LIKKGGGAMAFWERIDKLNLQEFKPGIMSQAEFGEGLTMVCMKIKPEMQDTGHEHPFDQCGIVIEGEIEMFVENDKRILKEMDTYFIPSGVFHGWQTFAESVRLFDISSKTI